MQKLQVLLKELQRLRFCFCYQSADFFLEPMMFGLCHLMEFHQCAPYLLGVVQVPAGVRWTWIRLPSLDCFRYQTAQLG